LVLLVGARWVRAPPAPFFTPLWGPSSGVLDEPPVPSAGALPSCGCTALPSAAAIELVWPVLPSLNRPFAMIVTASMIALDTACAMLMPTAAATFTPPDDVDADGVLAPPSDPSDGPPFELRVLPAKPRSCATCPSTPLPA